MSEKVTIELNVEQAQAVNAWIKNNQAIVQNTDALKALEQASDQAAKTGKSGFDGFKAAVMGALDPMNMLQSVVTLFRKELEEIQRLNQNAFNYQTKTGAIERKVNDQLRGADSNLSPAQLKQMIQEQSTLDRPTLYSAIYAGMKEQGAGGDRRRAAETAIAVGQLAPHLTEQIPDITAAAVALQKQSPDLTPAQAAAQIVQLARHNESEPGQISESMIPAVGRFPSFFNGKNDGGATAKAFYTTLQDSMDSDVGTAVGVGEKFIKELTTKGADAGLFKAGASVDEVFAAVQADTPEARRFREKFSVGKNAAAYPSLTEFLNRDSEFNRTFRDLREEFGGSPAEVEARERQFAEQGAAETPVYTIDQNLSAGIQDFQSDPVRGMQGLRKKFYETLAESGKSSLGRQGVEFGRTLQTLGQLPTPEEEIRWQIKQLEEREKYLRDPVMRSRGMNFAMGDEAFARMPADADRRADILQEQREVLYKILEVLERPTKVEITQFPPNVTPRPSPAGLLNDGM